MRKRGECTLGPRNPVGAKVQVAKVRLRMRFSPYDHCCLRPTEIERGTRVPWREVGTQAEKECISNKIPYFSAMDVATMVLFG